MENTPIVSGEAIRYGRESVKKDFWYFVGMAFIVGALSGFSGFGGKARIIFSILGIFLSTWMTAGYLKITLSYKDGKKLPFEDLFSQFKYFWKILGATILLGIIFMVGFIFLIIPGIYLVLRYQFTLNFIVDKDMSIGEAMEKSAKMTQGIKGSLIVFDLTCLGVFILGIICLGVGVLVAIPVTWLAQMFIYRKFNPATPAPAAQ